MVPAEGFHAPGEPRMPTPHTILHVRARVYVVPVRVSAAAKRLNHRPTQVLSRSVRGRRNLVLRSSRRCARRRSLLLCSWRYLARAQHAHGSAACERPAIFITRTLKIRRSIASLSRAVSVCSATFFGRTRSATSGTSKTRTRTRRRTLRERSFCITKSGAALSTTRELRATSWRKRVDPETGMRRHASSSSGTTCCLSYADTRRRMRGTITTCFARLLRSLCTRYTMHRKQPNKKFPSVITM
jgi:hypothetical protein